MSELVTELGPRLRLVEDRPQSAETASVVCPKLLELAAYFHGSGRRVFADFMWGYVGHPDPLQRLAGQQPSIVRRGVELGREIYSGFSADGTLLHVRMAPGAEAQEGFLVALSRNGKPTDEAKILNASHTSTTERTQTTLHMMDPEFTKSWPPLMRPGLQDQWRFNIEHSQNRTTATVKFGHRADEMFYPLEQLTQALEVLSQEPIRRIGHLSLVRSSVHESDVSQLAI